MFYSSLLFSLSAIINGSQQILVLPGERSEQSQQRGHEQDKELARAVERKVRGRAINHLYVYALQTPVMLLTFSVMTFLAGRGFVVFGPLARNLGWNDDAKVRAPYLDVKLLKDPGQVALVFGAASVITLAVFYSTSKIVHSLFQVP